MGSSGAGELRGRLLLGGRPATGVTVSAVPCEAPLDAARREARRLPPPPPIASATTAPDGSFLLAVPSVPGKETLFTVLVEGGGAVAASFGGVWDAAETASLGDHALLAASGLNGKVTDRAGTPVAGAEVVLLPRLDPVEEPELEAAPRRVTTAADGSFRFADASPTGNALEVDKPGFAAVRSAALRAGTLRMPIVLDKAVPLTGAVRGTDGASPAAGALVRLEGRVTTRWVEAGADGSFAVPDAPAGVVTAVADASEAGYVEQANVQLPLPQGVRLALVLRPAASLGGRTVDARTGRPVPRVTIGVRAGGTPRTTRSGPDGSYTLRLPPRAWQVRADEPRYVAWTHANVRVRAGETTKLDVPLVLGAAISGRVVDEDGAPLVEAKGTLSQLGAVSFPRLIQRLRGNVAPVFRTRNDGTFVATRLVPGDNQVLAVSRPEFEATTLGGLSLAPGATKAGIVIVLKRGAVVTGVVKDGRGQPIEGAEVALSQPFNVGGGRGRAMLLAGASGGPGATRHGTTGADGAFAIRGVAPGEHALTVARLGYASESVDPVKVPADKPPAPLAVTLTPGAVISGRVVHRSGTGAEGFTVSAVPPGRPRLFAGASGGQPTAADGVFSIEGLKPGQGYNLQFLGPTDAGIGRHNVVAPASDVTITVAGTGRITGTALDARDRHPLTEFELSYEPDRGNFRGAMRGIARSMSTDSNAGGPGKPVEVENSDGAFTLDDVPAGTWTVVVTAKGYQAARSAGIAVEEGATHEGVEVRLAKGTVVKGHVVDALTGAAVVGASVSLNPVGSSPGRGPVMVDAAAAEVTTDEDGRFEVEGVAPGKQSLHVTHPDYTDAAQIEDVDSDGADVEVRMTQGGVVAGNVTTDSGQPVPGATVTLSLSGSGGPGFGGFGAGEEQGLTDGSGQFRFDHLSAGRYTVGASLGSRTSAPTDLVLQGGTPQQVVTLRLLSGITIQGTVSGLPESMIGGMTVTASGADSYGQSSRVGADGRFEFDNVPAGVVTLRGTATDPNGSTRSATKQVTASDDQPLITTELVFDQGFTLSGRVTQAGQPVAGAMVFAALLGGGGRQASATSDDSGSYQLSGLQRGTYTVSALSTAAGGLSSRRQTVTLSSDQTLDIAFPGAKIAGQVVDADGNQPLANATVAIGSSDPGAAGGLGQRPVTTDSNGQFSFANLDEGSYTLSTSKPDYQLDTRQTTASDQGGETLVIALKRAAGIGVRVVDGLAGVPLPGVTVRVFDSGGTPVFGPSSISLDGNGRGEIPALAPATYTVVAAASGYAPVRLDGITVPSATVIIALTPGGTLLVKAGAKTLAAGSASGTITTAAGQPALLSLFNLQGRFVISEPNLQLRNVPPGSYLLALPAVDVAQAFTMSEGGQAVVQLP